MRRIVIYLILTLAPLYAYGQSDILRLPAIIGDHMVLQQSEEVMIWGWSQPRAVISIVAEWSPKDTIKVSTERTAKWETYLKTPKAGGPYKIQIFNKYKHVEIKDVMIGELWLCSGQSNMEWGGSRSEDGKKEQPESSNNQIRFFFIEKATAEYPQDDCHGYWRVCEPEQMGRFSAVGYFFGKKLHEDLGVPVGLIQSNWGGTGAETWTPAEKVNESETLKKSWEKLRAVTGWDLAPGLIYNAMINPITKMRLSGVIWYQGEHNVKNAHGYDELMRTLIQGWREKFQKNLPFYYVQIAPYKRYPIALSAALVREQQELTMALPNTGMIVVSDQVNDINNIHPVYKRQVGERLANWALAETYGKPVAKYRHATYDRMSIGKGEIKVHFNDVGKGLVSKKGAIQELEVAGDDGVFHAATGRIDDKDNTLVVSSSKVKSPKYVRYMFSNDGEGNIFDRDGLPVAPFRTDDFEIDLTPKKK